MSQRLVALLARLKSFAAAQLHRDVVPVLHRVFQLAAQSRVERIET
jgi:hypothetical protein